MAQRYFLSDGAATVRRIDWPMRCRLTQQSHRGGPAPTSRRRVLLLVDARASRAGGTRTRAGSRPRRDGGSTGPRHRSRCSCAARLRHRGHGRGRPGSRGLRRCRAMTSGPNSTRRRTRALPSPAQRRASRRQGRALLRAAAPRSGRRPLARRPRRGDGPTAPHHAGRARRGGGARPACTRGDGRADRRLSARSAGRPAPRSGCSASTRCAAAARPRPPRRATIDATVARTRPPARRGPPASCRTRPLRPLDLLAEAHRPSGGAPVCILRP